MFLRLIVADIIYQAVCGTMETELRVQARWYRQQKITPAKLEANEKLLLVARVDQPASHDLVLVDGVREMGIHAAGTDLVRKRNRLQATEVHSPPYLLELLQHHHEEQAVLENISAISSMVAETPVLHAETHPQTLLHLGCNQLHRRRLRQVVEEIVAAAVHAVDGDN
jgi:hypothetical protein